jgi:hypothetical protein
MPHTTPREGICAKCSQWRPLFQWNATDRSPDANVLFSTWLCHRHWSDATLLDEADGDVVRWLPPRRDSWDPWIRPPRTALERTLACGPIGKIRHFGPDGEVTP